jgi:hypothetical protein
MHTRIILNPSESQKQGFEAATFAENEVYGVDILVSSAGDGKVLARSDLILHRLIVRCRRAKKNRALQSTRAFLKSHIS